MKPRENSGLKFMTAKAFVLINAEVGREQDLIRQLRSIPNVTEVHVVYGVYDVIAKVEANTMEKVKETITNSLRRLDNVRSTLTMIAVEEDLT
jgi:DNA-binding Lrp family transcriptional regulator